jgi:hypothetical protein
MDRIDESGWMQQRLPLPRIGGGGSYETECRCTAPRRPKNGQVAGSGTPLRNSEVKPFVPLYPAGLQGLHTEEAMKLNTHRNRRTELPISAAQRTVIMIICSQFGISKAERQAMLKDRYGKSSTADLSSDQAGHFIKEFEAKGFVLKPKKGAAPRPRKAPRPQIPRSTGNVVALANRDEIDKINAVAGLIEWRVENGLTLFLEKRMGIKDGRVRTSKDAYLAIEALKKMFENQMKAKHGKDWWRGVQSDAVMEYISLHCPEEYR